MDSYALAAQKRSIRTIKTELDFLLDSSLLTAQQVSAITALLPEPKATNNISTNNNNTSRSEVTSQPTPLPAPTFNNARNTFSEKQPQQPVAAYQPSPPVYSNGPAPIATASALYAYLPTDSGDLALQPHDQVQILENMNADWARGRNERTGDEGIFPRSYVSVNEEKSSAPGLPYRAQQSLVQTNGSGAGYGNVPLEVSNGNGNNGVVAQNGEQPNKVNEQGKKFGKKLGNAAIFGAGATIGSNLVNSIF